MCWGPRSETRSKWDKGGRNETKSIARYVSQIYNNSAQWLVTAATEDRLNDYEKLCPSEKQPMEFSCPWWLLRSHYYRETNVHSLPRRLMESWAASKRVWPADGREILPRCSTLVRPHLECCIWPWGPQHKKDMDLLKWIQRRPQSWSKGGSASFRKTAWESWGFSA